MFFILGVLAITGAARCEDETAVMLGGAGAGDLVDIWPLCGGDNDVTVPRLPVPYLEQAPRAQVLDGDLYLCGGFRTGVRSECLKLSDNAWSDGPAMLESRQFFTLTTVGDSIVAVGGKNGEPDFNDSNTVEVLRDGVWRYLDEASLAKSRVNHCAAAISSTEMVIVGGWDGEQIVDTVLRLDIQTGTWTEIAKMDHGRSYPSCAVWQNQLIIAGGSWVKPDLNSTDLNTVISLDLSTLNWSNLPSMNVTRYGSSMVVLNEKPTVIGGYNSYKTVEVYENGAWAFHSFQNETVASGHDAVAVFPCARVRKTTL